MSSPDGFDRQRQRRLAGGRNAALANSVTAPAKRHVVWVVDAIAGGTPEASYPLIDALQSISRDVRVQAARALGERAVPIAVEPLLKRLNDCDLAVRLQAVIALGRIGSSEAIPDILPLLSESDAFVSFSARQALRRIDDWSVAARGLDSPDPKVRTGTLLAMDQVYDAGPPAGWRSSPCRPSGESRSG